MSEVLIWRKPKPPGPHRDSVGYDSMGNALYRAADPFDTVVLARGEREAMLKRWAMADKRLRAYGLPGHVEVRDESDPKVPQDRWWTAATTPASWLATMAGDKVIVRIYGNTYVATVVRAGVKTVDARFAATTRKGGWGGGSPLRVRTFPLDGGTYNRGVERMSQMVPQP